MIAAGSSALVACVLLVGPPGQSVSPADTIPPLERAYELLRSDEPAEAREPLLEAGAEASGSRATALLRVASVLGRVEEPAQRIAARAFLTSEEGAQDEAVRVVEAGVDGVRPEDRPALLSLAAELADGFAPERAAALRARLLDDHFDAVEAPEAAVRLARHRARSRDGLEDAVRILEALLVSRPGHPLAPEARRELERLRPRSSPGRDAR